METITDYPRQFLAFVDRQPPGPWLYSGGLENFPKLVDEICRRRPLWGIGGHSLCDVRDPVGLHEALRQAQLPTPTTTRKIDAIPPRQRWLRKPTRSCAGVNIEFLGHSSSPESEAKSDGWYYQAYVDGTPLSAVFAAQGGRAQLLGVTRQIIGAMWAGASGFQYTGSVGPIDMSDACAAQVTRIGDVVTEKFAMRGLFGVDGVLQGDRFWVVEVNPRYTASVEILERAGIGPAMAIHAAEFCDDVDSPTGDASIAPTSQITHGKAIVYSQANVRIGDAFCQFVSGNNRLRDLALVADIPRRGSIITQGQPIATVFAEGADDAKVTERLKRRCDQLRRHLEHQ